MRTSTLRLSGVDVLRIDGSGVDVGGLVAGSRPVIRDFIDSLHEVSSTIEEFDAKHPGGTKVIVVHGFAPVSRYLSSFGEIWLVDELLTFRQSLRESLFASGLAKLPSVFLGSGDSCSPVLDIARMCEVRVWLDQGAVLRGSPGLWAETLLGGRAYPGLAPTGQVLKTRWEISVDGAQKVGFLDGCLGETGPDGHTLAGIIQGLAPMLRGIKGQEHQVAISSGDRRFREVIAHSRLKAAKVSVGSARNLVTALIRQPEDEGAAELGCVYLAMNRGRDPWLDAQSTAVKSRGSDPPVLAPQVFGAVVDLSEGILSPGYLLDLARMKGLVILTSSNLQPLPARLEAQKSALMVRMGTAKAQSFWDRNMIPCAPASMDPDRLALPLVRPKSDHSVEVILPGEGRWILDLIPGLAGALSSPVDGCRMVPAVVRGGDFPAGDSRRWFEKKPGFGNMLRVFATGALFSETLDLRSYRSLFHFILAWQCAQSGWGHDEAWKELATNGWVIDDASFFRKSLEESGMPVSRVPGKASRDGQAPLPLVNLHARILAGSLARAHSDDPAGQAILLDISGIPSTDMAVLSGDEKPARMELSGLCGDSAVPFVALSPWRPASPVTGVRHGGVELPGTMNRQSAIEKHIRYCVAQMPQRILDTVAQKTQIKSSVWVDRMMRLN